MLNNELGLVGALVITVLCSPPVTSSVRPFAPAGEWRLADVADARTPRSEDDGEQWFTEGDSWRIESEVRRGAADALARHRVLMTWTRLPATLSAGQVVDLTATGLVLHGGDGLEAGAVLEVKAWRSESPLNGAEPVHATGLLALRLRPGDPAGTLARSDGVWMVPGEHEPDPASAGTLHVRATLTHRGNVLAYTRSYTYVPFALRAAATSAD